MALSGNFLLEANAIATNYIRSEIPDIMTTANAALSMLYKNKEYVDGGVQIQIPINFSELTSQGWHNGKFDTIDTNENQQFTYGVLDWKFKYFTVNITMDDYVKTAKTNLAVKSLIKAKVEAAKASVARDLSSAVHTTGSASNKQWNGFPDIFAASGTSYASILDTDVPNWLTLIDTTTQIINYSNIASMVRKLRGRIQTVGAVTSQYSLDLAISNSAVQQAFLDSAQIQQRFMNAEQLKVGFTGINFQGIDWVVDEYSAGSADGTTADNYLYFLTTKTMKLFHNMGFDGPSPFDQNIQLAAQPIKSDQVFFAGNMGCTNRRLNGVFKTLIA